MSRKSVLGCVFFPINVGRLLPLVSFSFICGLHAQTQVNLQSRTSFVPFLFCISSSPSRLQNDAAPILSASLCLSVFNMNLLSTSPVQRRKERFVVVFFPFQSASGYIEQLLTQTPPLRIRLGGAVWFFKAAMVPFCRYVWERCFWGKD